MDPNAHAVQGLLELQYALEERVKELDCLYGISSIVESSGGSIEVILQKIVELLPASWKHSEIACARIVIDGNSYATANFIETGWILSAVIRVDRAAVGTVAVCYLEERQQQAEGPFLAEERRLLNAVAERTGHIVERLRADHTIRQEEEELRGRLTHLTRVSTLGEMASSIAHEVNQPLTAIATYTQACRRMLAAGTTDIPEVLEILDRVTDEALRAGDIIHRLKDLARRRSSTRTECDINFLIKDLEQLASVDTRLHDVTLELQLSDGLPTVLADGIHIQQVLLNLVRNGVDAIVEGEPETREIVVRTRLRDEAKVEISVVDTGCGLPADCDEELFQPFFTTKRDGMGMGLSVSRSIVTAHGGQMWFSRNEDGGTTFFVTLPIAPED